MFLFKSVRDTHLYFRLFSSGHKPIVQAYFYLIFSQVLQPPKVRPALYAGAVHVCMLTWQVLDCFMQSPKLCAKSGCLRQHLDILRPLTCSKTCHSGHCSNFQGFVWQSCTSLDLFCMQKPHTTLHKNGRTQSLPPSVTRLSWCWYGLEKRLATTRDN